MIPLRKALLSSVGKKFIMALSGLALVAWLIAHLAGNLLLYSPDPTHFNLYAHNMTSNRTLLYVMEFFFFLLFGAHIVTAILVKRNNLKARPQRYAVYKPKQGASVPTNRSSRAMAVTGIALLVFLVLHVAHFRLGPGVEEGYAAVYEGGKIRDVYGLVQESFQNPVFAFGYVLIMLVMGLHVRHGFWSAFQSLGAAYPRWSRQIHVAAFMLAALLTVGFLLIPLWFFFDIPGRLL